MTEPHFSSPPRSSAGSWFHSALQRFIYDLLHQPPIHKTILGFALLAAVFGWFERGYRTTAVQPSANAPTVAPGKPGSALPPKAVPSWPGRAGAGLLLGYAIGWAFRAFKKLMFTITVVGMALLLALSYGNVLNVDLTAARHHFSDSTSWVNNQALRLRHAGWAHVHSTGAGLIGIFLGARRKSGFNLSETHP